MSDLAAEQLGRYAAPEEVSNPAVAPGWTDLSSRGPGEGLRVRAAAERDARAGREVPGWPSARREADDRWRLGLEGEKLVGYRLDRLRARGWQVLHSIPVGQHGADIDHVLIGPGGVFTINTKHRPRKLVHLYRDRIVVGAGDHDYAEKSRHEGRRAGRLLSTALGHDVEVQPVLVFHAHSRIQVHQPVSGVLVLGSFAVPAAFRTMRQRLDDHQVAQIFEHARRSTTWID